MNAMQGTFSLIGGIIVGLLLVGLLYQIMGNRYVKRQYVPLGKCIDVGGHCLHFYCMGAEVGRPTVIFDAGLGGNSLDWCKVQTEISQLTRTCSYDRAGYGWSDPGPLPRTSKQIVIELHQLLEQANIPGPYILIGHSFGGLNVRLYTDMYPQEVSGLVLVDTSHENMEDVPAIRRLQTLSKRINNVTRILVTFGIGRFLIMSGLFKLPAYAPSVLPTAKALLSQSSTTRTSSNELQAFDESMAQVRASRHTYGDLPLVVLTRERSAILSGEIEAAWQVLQRDLTTLSTQCTHIVVPKSDHYIHLDEPKFVIQAITSMLQHIEQSS